MALLIQPPRFRQEHSARSGKSCEAAWNAAWLPRAFCPAVLKVRRRAKRLAERLREKSVSGAGGDPLAPLDWVTVYAMAVNEENAAGGRVVTAPTNGAAGVIPAVAQYYLNIRCQGADDEGILRLLSYFCRDRHSLQRERLDLRSAEVGCQGEVGVACSMAAGGLSRCPRTRPTTRSSTLPRSVWNTTSA